MIKKFSAVSASNCQGMKIWSLLFNIIPLQGNALSPSLLELAYPFQIEVFFLVPQVLDSRFSALAGQCICSHVASCLNAATECGFEVLPHTPYSPDMVPSDFCLFPKLKSNLRETQFGSNEGFIEAVNKYLGDQEKDFYLQGISKLEEMD